MNYRTKFLFFKRIANLQVAILLLIILAFLILIGTLIEQNQSIEFYKTNYPLNSPLFGFLTWKIIMFCMFDHIYNTWFFFSRSFCLQVP